MGMDIRKPDFVAGKIKKAQISPGIFYLSGARGLLNLGKKHLDHQNWENLMQSKMKKVNKQCLLDTPRTVRVSEKTWQAIVQTSIP